MISKVVKKRLRTREIRLLKNRSKVPETIYLFFTNTSFDHHHHHHHPSLNEIKPLQATNPIEIQNSKSKILLSLTIDILSQFRRLFWSIKIIYYSKMSFLIEHSYNNFFLFFFFKFLFPISNPRVKKKKKIKLPIQF